MDERGTDETKKNDDQPAGRRALQRREHGSSSTRGILSHTESACRPRKPCYNRARLEKHPAPVKEKIGSPEARAMSSQASFQHHAGARQTLPENRRCSSHGGCFSIGVSFVVEPRPHSSSANLT